MNQTTQKAVTVVTLGLCLGSGAWAAQKPDTTTGGSTAKLDVAVVTQQLKSSDPAQVQAALEAVRVELRDKSRVSGNVDRWLPVLIQTGRFAETQQMAEQVIREFPVDVKTVESNQRYRVRALLGLGRHEEALAQAKAFYNVCRMEKTADAILLLQECLRLARPDDAGIAERFRQEQVAGAAATATPPSPESAVRSPESKIDSGLKTQGTGPLPGSGPRSTVLDSIKLDGKAYDEALAKLTASDYRTLAGRGNLLLLADRVGEAKAAFDEAYALAGDKDLAAASENIARCMRASDGTIGRANAWVLSIRPKK